MPEKVLSVVIAGWEQGCYISPAACKGQCKGMSMRNTKKKIWKDKIFLSMMMLCLVAVITVAANVISNRDTEQLESSELEGTTSMEETEEQQAVNGTEADRVDNGGKILVQEDTDEDENESTEDTDASQAVAQKEAGEDKTESEGETPAENQADAVSSQINNNPVLQYDGTTAMVWPVEGSLLMDYAMDHTVYHQTLEQYKVSPAIIIQGEAGTHVTTPAIGLVQELGWDEEIGNFLRIDLGNGYEAIIGQLENITVQPGQYVAPGNILGTIAQPTKYYSVEGPNVYFRLNRDGSAIDPIDYLE